MTKFRFRFDARGAPLDVVQPQLAELAELAEALPRVVAVEPQKVALPHPAIAVVRELEAWIDDHPEFGLDMSLLEERGVLLAPPHWSYVVDTLGAGVYTDDDRQTLDKYARMLAEREAELDEALQVAAAASVASRSSEPADRFRDALRALPTGGVVVRDREDFPVPEPLQLLLHERRAAEWAEMVKAQCAAIERAARELKLDWKNEEEQAWKKWKERFRKYRRLRRNFEMNMTDLLLRTRGAGPAALFRNDLLQMTLREWSDAWLVAIQGKLPPPSQLPVPSWVGEEISRELFKVSPTFLLIVGTPSGSSSSQWLPSQKNGCLWLDATVDPSLNRLPIVVRREAIIAFEVAGSIDEIGRAVRANPPALSMMLPSLGSSTAAVFFGKDKLPSEIVPVLAYIENPKDADDLVSKVRALKRGTA
jgi:hypothetical protein